MAVNKFNHKQFFLIFACIFIALIRFWKAGEWFSFNFDEEYQAFLAWSQVQDFHPIWIGVSAGNIGFYLGPAFTYLNALLFAISKGDPLILAYFAPALGILTITSIYYVVSRTFSPKIAFFSSLVYAISPLQNFYDRRFWNPSPIPFLTIWLFFALQKAKQNTRWFILVSAIMATALHVHLSLLVFWPIIFYLITKHFKQIHWSTWIISILVYLFLVSPLLVYDKVHNFDNLRTPIRMLSSKGSVSSGVPYFEHTRQAWAALSRFWYLNPHTSIQSEMGFVVPGTPTPSVFLLSAFSVFIIFFLCSKARADHKYLLLLCMLLFPLFSFVVYPSYTLEYYLLSFLTLFSISVGIWLSSINVKISWVFVFVFAMASATTMFTCNQSQYGLLARKNKIMKISQTINNKPYSVILGAKEGVLYSAYGGWCYLFHTYAGKPVSCPADESFGWIYKTENNAKSEAQIDMMRDLEL